MGPVRAKAALTRSAPLLMLVVRTTASPPDVRPSHLHRSSVRSCQVAPGARVAAEDHRAGRGRKIFRCCSGAVDGSPTGSDTADSREDRAPSRNSIRDSTRCNGVCSRPPAPSYRLLIERLTAAMLLVAAIVFEVIGSRARIVTGAKCGPRYYG